MKLPDWAIECISSCELEKRVLSSESSGVLFVVCSEMGWTIPGVPLDPALPILICQNLGARVSDNIAASIATGVNDLVVYGHYPCQGFSCHERHWLDRLDATERHILAEVSKLMTLPLIPQLLQQGKLRLHAWMLMSGMVEILSYDPAIRSFRGCTCSHQQSD